MYVSQLRITRKELNVDAIALRMRNESAKTKNPFGFIPHPGIPGIYIVHVRC